MDRRSSTWKRLSDGAPSIDELLTEELDGEQYLIPLEPRCRVCSLANSDLPGAGAVFERINRFLICGLPYRAVLRHIQPFMEEWPSTDRVSYDSIRNHQIRHLLVDEVVVREIVERRAAKRARRILDGSAPLITQDAVLEAVVTLGVADLARGSLKPSVRDLLNAAASLDDLDRAGQGDSTTDLDLVLEAVRSVVPPAMWESVITRFEALRERGETANMPGKDAK